MDSKDKAKELVNSIYKTLTKTYTDNDLSQILANKMWYEEAKQCALIAVDEIIKFCPYISIKNRSELDEIRASDYMFVSYWQEVKQEINKL